MLLYLGALWQLVRFEYYIWRGDFALLYGKVREYPCSSTPQKGELAAAACRAIAILCVFYPKRVLCLQRSAATACLLRRCGLPAKLVIGAQKTPFRAHAWVELDGSVVGDKASNPEIYAVLDRC